MAARSRVPIMSYELRFEPGLTRPYALTGGRTVGATNLPLEAVVVTERSSLSVGTSPEMAAIVDLCRSPYSIIEIATHLRLPLGVVRLQRHPAP